MNNQNNQGVPINQATQGVNPTYLAHDLDKPIRSYASPNLYDFNPEITYPTFGENVQFENKHVMLQMNQNVGQFRDHSSQESHHHIHNFYSIWHPSTCLTCQ